MHGMHTCVNVYVYTCICKYLSLHINRIYVHTYIYICTERERERKMDSKLQWIHMSALLTQATCLHWVVRHACESWSSRRAHYLVEVTMETILWELGPVRRNRPSGIAQSQAKRGCNGRLLTALLPTCTNVTASEVVGSGMH